MTNKSTGWLNLTGVICYFMGIACLSTLILIPFGIYCFIGGSRYFSWSTMSDSELYKHKNSLRNWAIYVSIVAFPVGLVSIIPFIKTGNNPVVSDVKVETKEDQASKDESENKAEEMGITVETQTEPQTQHKNSVSTKEETLEKLKKFKDDGLITEAEYKKAVNELNKE